MKNIQPVAGAVACAAFFQNKNTTRTTQAENWVLTPLTGKLFAYPPTCEASIPIPSMHGIFPYIFHKNQPNVGKYTIHGCYGICWVRFLVTFAFWVFFSFQLKPFFEIWPSRTCHTKCRHVMTCWHVIHMWPSYPKRRHPRGMITCPPEVHTYRPSVWVSNVSL